MGGDRWGKGLKTSPEDELPRCKDPPTAHWGTWSWNLMTLETEKTHELPAEDREGKIKNQIEGFPGGSVVKNPPAMQGTWVGALVQEDPTCHRATKPVRRNYWACALEPTSHNYWARVPQLLKPACLEPVLRNKRSHRDEKRVHGNKELPPLAATREPVNSNEDPTRPKINK